MMLIQCEFSTHPQRPQSHLKSEKLTTPPPPMLEIFIVLNEKDNEKKTKGRGVPMTPK